MNPNWAKLEAQHLREPNWDTCGNCEKDAELNSRGECETCYQDRKDAAAEHAFESARDER